MVWAFRILWSSLNLMNPRPFKIYLSGPMDALTLQEAREWRAEVTDLFKNAQITTHDPTQFINRKFLKSKRAIGEMSYEEIEAPSASQIIERDLRDLSRCQLVLCNLLLPAKLENRKIPIGTIMELALAKRVYKIPVYVVTNCVKGRPWIDGMAAKIFDNLRVCVREIIKGRYGSL